MDIYQCDNQILTETISDNILSKPLLLTDVMLKKYVVFASRFSITYVDNDGLSIAIVLSRLSADVPKYTLYPLKSIKLEPSEFDVAGSHFNVTTRVLIEDVSMLDDESALSVTGKPGTIESVVCPVQAINPSDNVIRSKMFLIVELNIICNSSY